MTTPTIPPPPPTLSTASNVDLLLAIVRLETKLDIITGQHAPQITDHETRIRHLERSRWPLPSIATLAAVGAIVVNFWHR